MVEERDNIPTDEQITRTCDKRLKTRMKHQI